MYEPNYQRTYYHFCRIEIVIFFFQKLNLNKTRVYSAIINLEGKLEL